MSDNALRIVRPAPYGSKRGWLPRTTLLPPETAERLDQVASSRNQTRVDAMHEAIERFIVTETRRAA